MNRNDMAGEHPWGDKGQFTLFILFLTVWVSDSFILKFSTILSAFVPLYVRLPLVVFIFVLAGYLTRSGHIVFHEKSGAHITDTGAFGYIRHPIYSGTILFYAGLAVSTLSLISLGLLVIIFIFYDYIAKYEEKLLENKYGEEYLKYKKTVPKWIPKKKK
jgi:protein-S-isoprenylcysteine O-methyltransferase Ste14